MATFSVSRIRFQRGSSAMRWAALESKMLSAAAYDDSKQTLYLRFRNTGAVYRYFEFTTAYYQAFLMSESKGRFFPLSYPRSLPLRTHGQAPRRLISSQPILPHTHLLWWRPFRFRPLC